MSRIVNSTKNAFANIIGQVIQVVLQFLCRTIFIKLLSTEYLGLNGLFTNVLSMLSLAELGFGNALIYSMYKPIHNNDKKQICHLINFYRKIYIYITIIIFILGISLLPFLQNFIKDFENYNELENLYLIYILYLINTLCSYVYIYKRSIIDANQKNYITIIIQKAVNIFQNIIQIIFLYLTKNFIIYLIIQIICTLVSNIIISKIADKMFPYLKEDTKNLPEKYEQHKILKN